MIRKIYLLVSVLGLIILTVSIGLSQSQTPHRLTFSDLEKYDGVTESFQIDGFVLDIYKCPPCPPGAMCKPCIPNNISIADSNDWTDLSKLKRLRVYTDQTDKFQSKRHYRLTVRIIKGLQAGKPIDSVDLISSAELPANSGPAGTWTGESICTIRDSPCHDEQVIYHISKADLPGKFKIEADKLVNGQPEEMGTFDCTFEGKSSKIVCQMSNGIWEFSVLDDKMTGTLKLTDGRLYRQIAVAKEK